MNYNNYEYHQTLIKYLLLLDMIQKTTFPRYKKDEKIQIRLHKRNGRKVGKRRSKRR